VSNVLWNRVLLPEQGDSPCSRVYSVYGDDFRVEHTAVFAAGDEEIVRLPEPRVYQVLNRTGLLLVAAGLDSREVLAPFLKEDPFSVGLYCAVEREHDFLTPKRMLDTPAEEFAATYKSLRSPKQFFKELPNIPPSQLGIILGAMGPQYVFSHSRWASLHALEQAEIDVQTEVVRAALVCSATSLEDPLVSMRNRRDVGDETLLSEAAAALVLTRSSEYTDWKSLCRPESKDRRSCGIADPLLCAATRTGRLVVA